MPRALAVACFFMALLAGCGLDTYYYLDPPFTDGHIAYYISSDPMQNYLSCVTNEEAGTGDNDIFFSSTSDFTFLGTEVYYKIYNNYSTMLSVESAISTLISSTSSSSAAANLIDTRGYKPLRLSSGTRTPLVPTGGSPSNRYVYIRLDDYDDNDYRASICIGSAKMDSYSAMDALVVGGAAVAPRRYVNAAYGFNFNSSSDSSPLPASGDADVTWSGSSSDSGVWYVDMYAISVGRDNTYATSYSTPLLLGSVAISESDHR